LHIDFYQLFDDKKIAMDIPVRLVGNAIGVKLGGNLQRNKRKLRIKALPTNLPDYIEIDISELNIGDRVYITELENENYEFLHPDNTVVCQVRRARAALVVETEDEEGEEGEETTEEGESTSEKAESSDKKEESSDGDAPAES
jgi:large subunit ribosomal protein L25